MDIDSLDVNSLSEQLGISLDKNYNIIEYITLVVVLIILIFIIYKYLFNNDKIGINKMNNIITQNVINTNIISILEDNSIKYPDFPALKVGGNESTTKSWIAVSYEDYFNNVKQFALSLNNWIGEGCTVAIIGSNCPAWYYSYLGCIANNGTSVGIYQASSSKTCEEIIKECDAQVIVVEDTEQLKKLVDIKLDKVKLILYYSPVSIELINSFGSIPVVSFGVFIENESSKSDNIKKNEKKWNKLKSSFDVNRTATIIYTSGTTGKSKGVIISHHNIISMIKMMFSTINNRFSISNLIFGSGERFISYLPLNHISGQIMDIYIPICLTGTVWFANKNALKGKGKSLINIIKDAKPTIFVGIPKIWEKIADQIKILLNNSSLNVLQKIMPKFVIKNKVLHEIGLDECKYCISTGATISNNIIEYYESLDIKIYDIYGLSETSGPITLSLPNYKRLGSVGILLDGLRIKINMDGEILVKGDSISSGYYKNKKETLKSYYKDWFKTGDIGHIDKGYLFITGKKNDIITIGGEKISPIPIENNIIKYLPDIEYVFVVGDKQKYLSMLLFPKEKYYSKYKQYNRLYGRDESLNTENESEDNSEDNSEIWEIKKIHDNINNKINEINKLSPNNSHKIKKWVIILNSFNIGDELTSMHTIRRSYLYKKFNKEIDKLYQ